MALVHMTVNPDGLIEVLTRIAIAIEHLTPPTPDSANPPYVATLSDLRRTDLESLNRIRGELDRYAHDHDVVIDSDAFLASIYEYEQKVVEAYGNEAILDLPWNKAAGGPLFKHYADFHAKRQAANNKANEGQQARTESPSETRRS